MDKVIIKDASMDLYRSTVEPNIKWNDCRLLHSGISNYKKERKCKLFCFNLFTTVAFQSKLELFVAIEELYKIN